MRLLPQHHDGRSVAAVAVAAHEVSHAVQHARGEPAFARRFELVRSCLDRPRRQRHPAAGAGRFILVKSRRCSCCRLSPVSCCWRSVIVVHLVTLPVEFDASFGKALPALKRGRYLARGDLPAARSVLRAAAWTYVAAALATLLDVARWFRVLLRQRRSRRDPRRGPEQSPNACLGIRQPSDDMACADCSAHPQPGEAVMQAQDLEVFKSLPLLMMCR